MIFNRIGGFPLRGKKSGLMKQQPSKSIFSSFLFILVMLMISGFGEVSPSETDPQITEISKAIREGNAQTLAKHFNQSVEISLPGREDVFSKTQAEQVVADFLKKNKPTAYQIQHQSGPLDSRYIIGSMNTANGNFRVYFLLKKEGGKSLIHLMKFEKD